MDKIKVQWLSRHEMTDEQRADLAVCLNLDVSRLEIIPRNITWAASEDTMADQKANIALWDELLETGWLITGVFSPVALETMPAYRTRLYSPVSRQAPELRVGDGPIPFKHLRWCRIN